MSFTRELEVARELARRAGALILEHYGRGFTVEYKSKDDPVTQADKDANRIIVEGLQAAFPDDGILAEESGGTDDRRSRARLWCVDPLDGTREFIERNGQFVVMIGLAVLGEARAGVVYQPTEDTLWFGAGEQAFVEKDGVARAEAITCGGSARRRARGLALARVGYSDQNSGDAGCRPRRSGRQCGPQGGPRRIR